MIKIIISQSCASCRKTKDWFKAYNIPFREINLSTTKLTKKLLKEVLTKSVDGFDEILSTRSHESKNRTFDIEELSFEKTLDYIIANPTVLKRPIIIGKYSIHVGYNAQEIQRFAPKELRQKLMDELVIEEYDEEDGGDE